MTERTGEKPSRRETLRDIVRYLALAGLAGTAGALAARRRPAPQKETCARRLACARCPLLARCRLPRAVAARREPTEG